jgi:hypothetical protein
MIQADGALALLPGSVQRRHQDGHQDGDDGDDHEKLDQRESAPGPFESRTAAMFLRQVESAVSSLPAHDEAPFTQGQETLFIRTANEFTELLYDGTGVDAKGI